MNHVACRARRSALIAVFVSALAAMGEQLRAQDLAELDAQLLAAVRDVKGDPLEVLGRMRAAAVADPTHDLLYLLLTRSEGRSRDSAEAKACAERFDTAWKARATSGLDVEAMKQRLRSLGLERACEDLGVPFDPAALRELAKDMAAAMLPTRKGAVELRKAANGEVGRRRQTIASTSQAIDNAGNRIRQAKQEISEARRKLRLERDANKRVALEQRIRDWEPRQKKAEDDQARNQEKLREHEAALEVAQKAARRLEKRLERLFPD